MGGPKRVEAWRDENADMSKTQRKNLESAAIEAFEFKNR